MTDIKRMNPERESESFSDGYLLGNKLAENYTEEGKHYGNKNYTYSFRNLKS